MLTLLKLAKPLTAFRGLEVTVSVPPAGLVPMARVIEAVELVTTLPFASSMVMMGWVVNGVPAVPGEGCWVKTSLVGTPEPVEPPTPVPDPPPAPEVTLPEILKGEQAAEVKPGQVAVKV